MSIAQTPLLTTEDLLALPDENGVNRELFRGVLRERPMTLRNRRHSRVETRIAKYLDNWLDECPEPRGQVLSGEAGFRLRRDPDTFVGIDVAFVSAEVLADTPASSSFVEGAPLLAVEILSPSETHEDVSAKVDAYLEAGVALVWVVDPHFRTISVYRPDAEPEQFNITQELSGEPHLPGFRVALSEIFGARS